MKVLVTGGCGFIGSHTVVSLLDDNYDVVIVDNLSNSKRSVIDNIKKITNKDVIFYEIDLCDKEKLDKVFSENQIDAVIHFAGFKAVFESVLNPLMYYQNNLISTMNLLEIMDKYHVYHLIFSSSATVYGNPISLPIKEDFSLHTTNPYGSTKLFIEQMLKDVYNSNKDKWDITILRYFNPVGAHKSLLIGEDPNGIPNNLMPYIVKVATGELEVLSIFGDDYNTVDGTGVRDYIHVVDLANGHLLSLKNNKKGLKIYNLGTGVGTSVLELVTRFEKVNNIKVNKVIAKRRDGDIDACYASCLKAYDELNFKCMYTIDDMCLDSYNYVLKNKN